MKRRTLYSTVLIGAALLCTACTSGVGQSTVTLTNSTVQECETLYFDTEETAVDCWVVCPGFPERFRLRISRPLIARIEIHNVQRKKVRE